MIALVVLLPVLLSVSISAIRLSQSDSSSMSNKLYEQQAQAVRARSVHEKSIIPSTIELLAPELSGKSKSDVISGTGFSSPTSSRIGMLAQAQAEHLKDNGVIRIDNALSDSACDNMKDFLVADLAGALKAVETGACSEESRFGIELRRGNRYDLLLSLQSPDTSVDIPPTLPSESSESLTSSVATTSGKGNKKKKNNNRKITTTKEKMMNNGKGSRSTTSSVNPLLNTLDELLGKKGTLRPLLELLVGPDATLYELASMITNPGCYRQIIHMDLPYQQVCPLYVVFLALHDVPVTSGATIFLPGTHKEKYSSLFTNRATRDELLAAGGSPGNPPVHASLKKGSLVLFDARVLHAGGANDVNEGQDRYLFNFSFRNPEATDQHLSTIPEYPPSIRPEYVNQLTLRDLLLASNSNSNRKTSASNINPFAAWGSGLRDT
mmetsp:Transcript_23748/g.39713  ORF Transcript_23748/g.39713 Transcript_23748/m.39713 type:complete len:437 (+) Transcript_23748:417-1727(+)|eukprot:CAMPEP_0175003102 /NCGR_PEP_ID=MMETSP0005-20121125/4044_1 /TAXON_ID=420556 /ORGANISM="Ochromonas sp., Strain CCMP1393" /LENGTH=436 /DNA_ID=CAMNT_0016258145 /DNA_START=280 /DNA_END=1590 /DNA_ORIENTATION=-